MELNLELAKELSQKKWQFIVDNDGSKKGVKKFIPELKSMHSECAMCEWVFGNNNSSCLDYSCIYYYLCGKFYHKWKNNRTVENATAILEAIKEVNKL